MFEDNNCTLIHPGRVSYETWRRELVKLIKEEKQRREEGEERVRLVILEIGAGRRVPTVRMHNEGLLREVGGEGRLVRVNMDEIAGGTTSLMKEKDLERVVGVQMGGVDCLRKVEGFYEASKNSLG